MGWDGRWIVAVIRYRCMREGTVLSRYEPEIDRHIWMVIP